jgi:hypothetical protein
MIKGYPDLLRLKVDSAGVQSLKNDVDATLILCGLVLPDDSGMDDAIVVGGGEKGYQFSGRKGASGAVTLCPSTRTANWEGANSCFAQAVLSSPLV